jgi:hypothetical protein
VTGPYYCGKNTHIIISAKRIGSKEKIRFLRETDKFAPIGVPFICIPTLITVEPY